MAYTDEGDIDLEGFWVNYIVKNVIALGILYLFIFFMWFS